MGPLGSFYHEIWGIPGCWISIQDWDGWPQNTNGRIGKRSGHLGSSNLNRHTESSMGNSIKTRCDIPILTSVQYQSYSPKPIKSINAPFGSSAPNVSYVFHSKRSHHHVWGSGQLLEFEVGLIPKPQVVACSVARVSSLSSAKWKWQKRFPQIKRETVSLESKFEDTQLLLESV